MEFRKISQFGKLLKYKFIVKCPRCNNIQGYIPRKKKLTTKSNTQCLRCGKNFRIRPNLIKEANYGEKVERIIK